MLDAGLARRVQLRGPRGDDRVVLGVHRDERPRVRGRSQQKRVVVTALDEFNVEIGAGLGPLAGKIWRIGLMGASSAPGLIALLLGALESALAAQRHRAHV